jgi:hypothetical protein
MLVNYDNNPKNSGLNYKKVIAVVLPCVPTPWKFRLSFGSFGQAKEQKKHQHNFN